MGRRKIEIRPIKDDRNRSVTFLKRKGGLFKKAYELSVLCSVDVAVIIFGNNKKLYEFSSGDINETISRHHYYGQAHEHKGPNDFAGKGGGDEEEEDGEDAGSPLPPNSHSPPDPAAMMHRPLQNQPGLQHMRNVTPSASPPIGNGAIPAFPQRVMTPQPNGSRPASRLSHVRRASSNLVPPHMGTPSQAPPPQPSYAYSPNPPYHQQNLGPMQRGPTQPYPVQPPPHFHAVYPHAPVTTHQQIAQVQAHQAYIQEQQRRQSVPPTFMNHMQQQHHVQQQPGPPRQGQPMPQQQPQQQQQQAQPGAMGSVHGTPQPDQASFQSPPLPQPKPLPAHAKSHSIFTPIDDSRSLLAQHWGSSSHTNELAIKQEEPRSQSIDVAAMSRDKNTTPQPPQPPSQPLQPPQQPVQRASFPPPPQRTASTSSVSALARPGATDAKRPRLKVQIPSEHSDAGSTAGGSSPRGTATSAGPTPMRAGQSSVVLPPPSPSANTILSAGATGPPNPFARPPPPMSTNPHVNRDREHIETPLSALPSRVMDGNQMLPSPSTFWSDVWFGKDNNMMPSPLNFQTPVALKGPGFDDDEKKRKAEEDNGGGGKRPKT